MKPKVFISYSSKNSALKNKVVKILDEIGIQSYVDTKDMAWGDGVTEYISTALSECSHLLVIVSQASLKSDWVPFEIGQAIGLRKRVLPFVTDPDPRRIPLYLRALHYKTQLSEIKQYFRDIEDHKTKRVLVLPVPEPFDFAGTSIPFLVLDGTGESQNVYLRENITTHYSPVSMPFPNDLIRLKSCIAREEEKKKQKGEPYCWNGPMYLFEKFSRSRTPDKELPVIDLWFRDSDYFSFLTTNYDPAGRIVYDENRRAASVEEKYMKQWDYLKPIPFCTISFGVTLSILTRDNYLILTKRSAEVYGYRNVYDTSVVEGMRPGDDVDERRCPDPYKTAVRGTDEELGISIRPEQVTFLSFGVKTKDKQYGLLGLSKADSSRKELEKLLAMKLGKDEWEAKAMFLDVSDPLEALRFVNGNNPGSWSPNGLVCIVHALIHEHGKKKITSLMRTL